MCGIIGYLDKRPGREHPVGSVLLSMLRALSCRGPDSAGVAVFGAPQMCWVLQVALPANGDANSASEIVRAVQEVTPVTQHMTIGAYLRLEVDPEADAGAIESWLLKRVPGAEIVSLGRSLEIVKQVGSPDRLEEDYDVSHWVGTHGIGHTRLSTESRVDLSHSQPFWAHGVPDLVTVHNGHITNYHKLRRRYEQHGYRFWTENDSEVIGIYLRDRMQAGLSFEDALRSSLDDFDGSFSYLAANAGQLAFVKDRYGFKPLMVAETDDFVAIATEEVALRKALGRDFVAREPAPGMMRVWSVQEVKHAAANPAP